MKQGGFLLISFSHAVTSAPVNLTLIAQSSSSLLVSWDPPVGDVVRYIVISNNTGLGCEGIGMGMRHLVPPNITMFILSGLEEDEEYSVEVRAESPAALGPPTETLTMRTHIAG